MEDNKVVTSTPVSDERVKVKSVVGLPIRREEATKILTECYGANLLELDEFETRAELVQKATSLEEINKVIFDLPEKFLNSLTEFKTIAQQEVKEEYVATKNVKSKSLSHRHKQNKVISILSERSLEGNWLNDDEVTVLSIMGSSKLDFREVNFPDTEVVVTTSVIMGEVKIYVPKDVKVILDATPIMGDVKITADNTPKIVNDIKNKIFGNEKSIQKYSNQTNKNKVLIIKGIVIMGEVRVIQY